MPQLGGSQRMIEIEPEKGMILASAKGSPLLKIILDIFEAVTIEAENDLIATDPLIGAKAVQIKHLIAHCFRDMLITATYSIESAIERANGKAEPTAPKHRTLQERLEELATLSMGPEEG
jgi:hypothetical protein